MEKVLSALTLSVVMIIIKNGMFCTKEKRYDNFHDWNRSRPCAG